MSRRTSRAKNRTVPRKGTPSVLTKGSGNFSIIRLQRELAEDRARLRRQAEEGELDV